ncbi:MAG: hypothetical protein ACOH5I_08290 [Oligoflexus sp.]
MKIYWTQLFCLLQLGVGIACQQDSFENQVASKSLENHSLQDDQTSQSKGEKVVSEPVMVGGGFLHALCETYPSETEQEAYACGIFDESETKVQTASIHEIVINTEESQFVAVLSELPDESPWHVFFTIPADFQVDGNESIDIGFAIGEQKFKTKIESGLPKLAKEELVTELPKFAYPLANPSSIWLNDFSQDPTQLDTNNDSVADWKLGFGTIGAETIKDGLFYVDNNIRLNSQSSPALPGRASVDFSVRSLTAFEDGGAELWIHMIETPNAIGKIFFFLRKQEDGSQTLLAYTKTPTNPRFLQQEITGLADELISIAVLVETADRSFMLKVANTEYGPFNYVPIDEPSVDYIVIQSRESSSVFGHVNFAIED